MIIENWFVFLLVEFIVGRTFKATIWLLHFRWYWSLVVVLFISTITLTMMIPTSKQLVTEINALLFVLRQYELVWLIIRNAPIFRMIIELLGLVMLL